MRLSSIGGHHKAKFGHGIYDGNDICIGAEEMKPKGIWQGGKLFNSKKQWIFQWIQIGVLLLLAIAVVALTIVNVMGMRESIHASTERYVEDVARQLALDIETLLFGNGRAQLRGQCGLQRAYGRQGQRGAV